MQRKGLHNRYIFLYGLIVGISACALITDWQAIGGDLCDRFSDSCVGNITSSDYENDFTTISM